MPIHDSSERETRPVSAEGGASASSAPTPNSQARVGVTKYAAAGFADVSMAE